MSTGTLAVSWGPEVRWESSRKQSGHENLFGAETTGAVSSPSAANATEEIYNAFWYPLYLRAKQRGYTHEDACDLLQEFFLKALREGYFDRFDPEKASLATFVHLIFGRFLAKAERMKRTAKHGGGLTVLSLDEETSGDALMQSLGRQEEPPGALSDRPWARHLFARVLRGARRTKKHAPAPTRSRCTISEPSAPAGLPVNDQSPATLSSAAMRAATYRARQHIRAELRAQLELEFPGRTDIDEEVHYLLAVAAH